MKEAWQLAQLNIARMVAPIDSPELAGFVQNLDRINALADTSTGFVWRLQSEEGDATEFRPFGDDILVNMSVWSDLDSLHRYVYKTAHVEIMRKRRDWFERMREVYSVLWWVPAGEIPTVEEAAIKLQLLQEQGPSAEAFTFNDAFPSPGNEQSECRSLGTDCPAN